MRIVFGLAFLAVGVAAGGAPPQEVEALAWCAGAKDCLHWSAAPGATSYVVYRGEASSLARLATPDTDSCRVGTFAGTTTGPLLSAEPLPSDGLLWYLVAARNGDGEGDVGSGSAGPRLQDSWGDCCNQPVFLEGFAAPDGSPWSAPWTVVADSAATADVQDGEGRWQPRLSSVGYSLARLSAPTGVEGEHDVEVSYTFRFEEAASQGIGLYVRQNGGYCTADNTAACAPAAAGQGYALFIHGPFLGTYGMEFWKEEAGDEIQLAAPVPLPLADGVRYRVRFRVVQASATMTFLAAKLWPEAGAEPAAWQATLLDSTPSLQGEAANGGVGVDSFYLQAGTCGQAPSGHTFLDDIRVERICNPLESPPVPIEVAGPFGLTDGPCWRDDRLLFTDVTNDTIHELVPPSTVGTFRMPSQQASGLALDRDGDLFACEIAARRVTRTSAAGEVSVVMSEYGGLPLNAPHDLAVRADGTIFVTDPEYLIAGVREQPFLNLYRIPPNGPPVAEWSGTPGVDGPSGVALSPDERILYMANTETGVVLAFDVSDSGGLSLRAPLAAGLTAPDGLCVDTAGTVFVATADGLRAFTPAGDPLGTLAFPDDVTNCAFGGADLRTLYVTTSVDLWSMPMAVPGIAGRN